VGPWIFANEELIKSLVSWRQRSSNSFFAQVPPTSESMIKYLTSHSIGDDNRILFLVLDCNERFYGHVGLSHRNLTSIHIDNVLKGESHQEHLMFYAVHEVIKWASINLEVSDFFLEVRSDNLRAINFYSKIGFRLKNIQASNQELLVSVSKNAKSMTGEIAQRMVMSLKIS
jgi:RimJ/RimL family protein N-acetyltransferase